MFILNPYDRYFQKSNSATASKAQPLQPLHDSTNLNSSSSPLSTSRRLMETLSITRSKKASPLLSVATASASTPLPVVAPIPIPTKQRQPLVNCIPFPAFPLGIHTDGVISIESFSTCVGAGIGLTWPIDIQPASCSATEAHFQPRPRSPVRLPIGKVVPAEPPTGPPPKRVRLGSGRNSTFDNQKALEIANVRNEQELKNVLESAQYRRVCRRERGVEKRKPRKGGKKVVSDVKFLLALHKSIAWHIECADEETDVQASDAENEDELNAQDRLLARKLWDNLVVQGHDPHTPLPPTTAESISLTQDSPSTDVACLFSPDPFSPSAPSLIPVTSDVPPTADILTMPQVVASLILRHRTRTSISRPRPRPSCSTSSCRSGRSPEKRSPLSKIYIDGVRSF